MAMVGKNFINGEWLEGASGETFQSLNPANFEEVIGVFSRSRAEDVEKAVAAAKKAYPNWRDWSRIKRAELFDNLAQLFKRDFNQLSVLVTKECGKPLNEARADVTEGIHMTQYVFGRARMASGEVLASEIASKDAYMLRKSKGVVACITPWNFPFAIPIWLIAPSLLEGNTVVFKPSEDTPAVGQRLIELFEEAGFPPGVVNLIHGNEQAGRPLVAHPDVSVVLFTGSYQVGSEIRKICAEHFEKMAVCEMGGKNAVIVLADADLDLAVNASLISAYKTSGQRCTSVGRLIVEEKILDEFSEKLVKISKRINIGDGLQENVFMGPLINEAGVKKVAYHNEMAVKEGGEVLLEGGRLNNGEYAKGYFMSPLVYRMKNKPGSFVLREEAFGPHVAIIPVKDLDGAIEAYNDTEYGMAMSVITEDYRKAKEALKRCDFGVGYHNLPTIGAEVHLPFGGVKRSGTGMPSASTLIDVVTHRIAWTVNYGEEIAMAQGLSAKLED